MAFDQTAANFALKELFPKDRVENLIYSERPFLALVPKDTKFLGESMKLPVIYGSSQGAGTDLATAQSNLYSAKGKAFILTRKRDYVVERIERETLLAGALDIGAFLPTAEILMESVISTASKRLSAGLYRSGTGSIGAIATGGITTGVITLASPGDVVQFSIGQTLQAASTDGGTPRAALGYVISVDRDAGTVTVASSGQGGAAASPSGWAAGDYLLVQSDSNGRMSGLLAWLPDTAPTSTDSFYGVNRFDDVTRLAGIRYNGASQSVRECATGALIRVGREEGRPDIALTNFETFGALENELGAKVVYDPMKGPADIMFNALRFTGPKGTVKVIPDADCPARKMFFLQSNVWKFASLGKAPAIDDELDGNQWLRVYNADQGELRCITYGNLGCRAPGWNVNATTGA